MTLKAAAGGVNFGGGYILVLEQEGMIKKEPMFRALGRFIESFHGRFIAGEDIGITDESIEYMAMETKHLAGLPFCCGSIAKHSRMCAYGTFMGLLAAAKSRWGSDDISEKKVIVQGYGRIGSSMASMLKERGAHVLVAEILPEKQQQARDNGFELIDPGKAFMEKCDIFCPCAVGPIIDAGTAGLFQCEIIAGSANSQLSNDDDDILLKKRNILYAPDFVINVGGINAISGEYFGHPDEKARINTETIYERLLEILTYADKHDLSTNQAAIRYAEERIQIIKKIKGTYVRKGIMQK